MITKLIMISLVLLVVIEFTKNKEEEMMFV